MDGKNNSSFWPSYVDIMTTLFAIMLVLFAVSFSRFKVKEKQYQLLVNEYEDIINVYKTVNQIDDTDLFDYDSMYQKHLMTIEIQYQTAEYRIEDKLMQDKSDSVAADRIRQDIKDAGLLIRSKIDKLEHEIPDTLKKNIKFLVVIEGQSSRLAYHLDDWHNNYTLSYLRAQFLNKYWVSQGIDFDKMPRCEVVIAGSGEGGKPRYVVDEDSLRAHCPDEESYWKQWINEEMKNQRFLVHIVPVIGNIDVTKEKMNQLRGNESDEVEF